jgi:hypothetical protein
MLLTGETRFARRKACHSASLPTTCIGMVLNPGYRGERLATNSLGGSTLAALAVKVTYARVDRRELRTFPMCIAYRQDTQMNVVFVSLRLIHVFIRTFL